VGQLGKKAQKWGEEEMYMRQRRKEGRKIAKRLPQGGGKKIYGGGRGTGWGNNPA